MNADQAPPMRLYLPFMEGLYSNLSWLAYPLIRVVTGLWLVPHGAQKLFGGNIEGVAGFFAKIGLEPALPLAYLAGGVEFFGGILLTIGLFTRPAAAGAFILLLVAAVQVHLANGFFMTNGGYEYTAMWALFALAVFLRGGGELSVDRKIGREF